MTQLQTKLTYLERFSHLASNEAIKDEIREVSFLINQIKEIAKEVNLPYYEAKEKIKKGEVDLDNPPF